MEGKMKKFLMIMFSLAIMQALLLLPFEATAQEETDPEAVFRGIYDAINLGDIAGAMGLVADDAVVTILPPTGTGGVFIGKEEIQGWWEQLIANGGRIEFTDFQSFGDQAVWTAAVFDEANFAPLGLNPLYMNGGGIVQDGLMQAASWTFTAESLMRYKAAIALEANKMLVIRFMEELWREGNLEVTDELLSEDFVSYVYPEGGREELKAAVTGFRTDLPNGYFIVDEMIVTENKVVMRGSAVAEAPPAGEEPERLDHWIVILSIKEGKITDRWVAFVPTE
jgi:ketosteroid isomerase-like protein